MAFDYEQAPNWIHLQTKKQPYLIFGNRHGTSTRRADVDPSFLRLVHSKNRKPTVCSLLRPREVFGSIFARYVSLASQNPYPITGVFCDHS